MTLINIVVTMQFTHMYKKPLPQPSFTSSYKVKESPSTTPLNTLVAHWLARHSHERQYQVSGALGGTGNHEN